MHNILDPFKENKAYRFAGYDVGRLVSRFPTTCAPYNCRILSPLDFKLGTLVHINV